MMTVKFLIKKCLAKMQLKDFVDSPQGEREQEIVRGLLSAYGAVFREIISDYLPLVTSEKVSVSAGKIRASALSKQILYPICVKDGNRRLDFGTDPEYIYVADNDLKQATVEYAYLPTTEFNLNSEVCLMGASDDLIGDGMLANYYLATGMYDLARTYDASYREKLWRLRYRNKNLTLKERRWSK